MILPAKIVSRYGPKGKLPFVDRLFDVLHWILFLSIAALAVQRLPSFVFRADYFNLVVSLFLMSLAVSIFPLKMGRSRLVICWSLAALCLLLFVVSAENFGVVLPTLSALFFAGVCTILSVYLKPPAQRSSTRSAIV